MSDAFIRAGQFGSSRMGDFGSRAVRDESQEAVIMPNKLDTDANTGYATGNGSRTEQTDWTRQARS